MNSYIHLHKFHGSWINPFKDQIVPHACRLLLLTIQQQHVFFSFGFKYALKIYELGMVTSGSKCWQIFSWGIFLSSLFWKTVPGLDTSPLPLSCYTGTAMPGEWTLSPVAVTKWDKPNAETMQQGSEKCSIICDAIDVQKTDAWVPIWGSSKLWKIQ